MPKIYKSILVLGDGTEIAAGDANNSAVFSLTYTATVSSTTDLCPGAACANKIEFEIWVQPGESLTITSGTQISYYRQNLSTNDRTLVGTFWAIKPTRASRNTYKVYAYDAVSKLDGIQSTWLRSIQEQFPMSLWAFAQMVAQRCRLTISNTSLPRNGDYQVQAFYADNLTGRQLLSWVAEASCTFLRATPDGKLEFAWYTDFAELGIGPGTQASQWTGLKLAGEILTTSGNEIWIFSRPVAGYLSGGLSYEDYETAPIDKVQIKQSDDDVGVIYPPDETGTNALVVSGNLLLTTSTAEALQPVAQAIFETMRSITYTPLKAELFASEATDFAPGQIISGVDAYGRNLSAYIMTATYSGGKVSIESTGNARRDGTAAVNEQSYTNLQGRMLEISASVDGLKITASDLAGGMASLELTVDGLRTEVSGKLDGDEASTMIEQSLQGLTLSAEAGDQSSTLTLKAGEVTLSSADITFEGMVTFEDLSGSGKSTINGDNITTGKIGNANGNTLYDLDAGTLRTGRSNGSRVEMDDRGIKWYVENGGKSYLTGVLYSKYGATYIGDNSRYTFLGWFSSATPDFGWSSGGAHSNFVGIAIDQTGATIHCNASKFEIPGRIECSSLAVNGREI